MFKKLFVSEIKNILKNKFVITYCFILAAITFAFIRVSGDFHKTVLSLSNITITLIPLVSSFFTGIYWYYNDRYLELLLTQPIQRHKIMLARHFALSLVLGTASILGPLLPFLFYGHFSTEIFVLMLSNLLMTLVFVSSSLFICLFQHDRMKGMGLILGLWLYLVLIHDGFLLLVLIALKDYSLDILSGWLGVMNPLGLARVLMMLVLDGALLLGQVSAVVRNALSGNTIYIVGTLVFLVWVFVPLALSLKLMKNRDF